jgi:hypothetical protein
MNYQEIYYLVIVFEIIAIKQIGKISAQPAIRFQWVFWLVNGFATYGRNSYWIEETFDRIFLMALFFRLILIYAIQLNRHARYKG